jgi:hypothetical protein
MMKFIKTKLSLALITSAIISAPFAIADDTSFNSEIKKHLRTVKSALAFVLATKGVMKMA